MDPFTTATSKPNEYLNLNHNLFTTDDQTVVTNILLGKDNHYINGHPNIKKINIFQ